MKVEERRERRGLYPMGGGDGVVTPSGQRRCQSQILSDFHFSVHRGRRQKSGNKRSHATSVEIYRPRARLILIMQAAGAQPRAPLQWCCRGPTVTRARSIAAAAAASSHPGTLLQAVQCSGSLFPICALSLSSQSWPPPMLWISAGRRRSDGGENRAE